MVFIGLWCSSKRKNFSVRLSLLCIQLRRTVNGEEEFFVASSLYDKILVYERETGSNKLKLKKEIQAIVGLDNFGAGDDGYIYIGGHGDPWVRVFVRHWDNFSDSTQNIF